MAIPTPPPFGLVPHPDDIAMGQAEGPLFPADPKPCTPRCCSHCIKKAPLTTASKRPLAPSRKRSRPLTTASIRTLVLRVPWLPPLLRPTGASDSIRRIEIEIRTAIPGQLRVTDQDGPILSPTLSCYRFDFAAILPSIFMTMAPSAQSSINSNVDVHVKVKLVRAGTREPVVHVRETRLHVPDRPLSAPSENTPTFTQKAIKSIGKRPAPLAFIPDPPLPLAIPPPSRTPLSQSLCAFPPTPTDLSNTCECPHQRNPESTMPPSRSVGSTVAKSAPHVTRAGRTSRGHHANNSSNNRWSDRLLSVLVPLSVLSFVIPAIVSALLHAFSLPTAASSSPNRRHSDSSSSSPTNSNTKSRSSRSEEHMERYRQLRASHLKRTFAHNGGSQGKQQSASSMPRSWSDPELGLKSPTSTSPSIPIDHSSQPTAANRIPPLCELDKSASCPNLGRFSRRHPTSTSRSRNRSGSSSSTGKSNNNNDDTHSVCSSASTDDLDAISESTPFLLSPVASPQLGNPKTIPTTSEVNAFQSSSAALHRDSAVFPSPTSSLFSSRSTANDPPTDPRKSTTPVIAFNPTPYAPPPLHRPTTASSATTTVAPSPPTLHLSFPDPPVAPLLPPPSASAPTRFQLPTTPIDPQTHLRHLLACSGAAWWATRFAICDILTPRARRQLFLAQDMLIATSAEAGTNNALGTVCMAVVAEPEAARQALMAQLARSARVTCMLPLLDVVMPPAASLPTPGGGGAPGTGVREAVVVLPLSVMGSVADRVRVRRLAPSEAKAALSVVVGTMAKLAKVGVVFRGFKLDYILINGHIPDSQDLTPADLLVGGYHAMFDTPLPTASVPKLSSAFEPPGTTSSSPTVNSDVVTPDAARSIADLLTVVGKGMDPMRVHEAFAGLMAGSLASAGPATGAVMPGAWSTAPPPQMQVKDPSAAGVGQKQSSQGAGELTWSQLLRDLGPVLAL